MYNSYYGLSFNPFDKQQLKEYRFEADDEGVESDQRI